MSADFVPPPAPMMINSEEKIWAVLAHLSSFIGLPFFLPLVIYLLKRKESPYLAENAREAINFHITLFLAFLVCAILMFVLIGFFLAALLAVFAFVVAIVAAIRASEGGVYRYPCCLRLI
jgi:uncharacterized Tic20 family protein